MNEQMEEDVRWAEIIADCIEDNLALYLKGDRANMIFDVATKDIKLDDASNIKSSDVRAAWHLADSFIDSAWHGLPDMDGISWNEAVDFLRSVAYRLRKGEPIAGRH